MSQHLLGKVASSLIMVCIFAQSLTFAYPTQGKASPKFQTSSYPCKSILYDFSDTPHPWNWNYTWNRSWSTWGWIPTHDSEGYSMVFPVKGSDSPKNIPGNGSLSLNADLDRSHLSAEFQVDLFVDPPTCADKTEYGTPLWEPESVLSVWLWAPTGTRGDATFANGVHLFAVDQNGRKIYGTWQSIQENTWFEVTLRLGKEIPACGLKNFGFNPTQIRKLGLNFSLNSEKIIPLKSSIFMSRVTIKDKDFLPPVSDHFYSFDRVSGNDVFPRWQTYNRDWEADAFSGINITDGALVADANFVITKKDATRKGFLGLVYAPVLDLSFVDKAQDLFSLDIRFDSPNRPKAKCPFALTLWVFDSAKQTWYTSDYQNVGARDWVRVALHLAGFKPQALKYADQSIDLSQIGEIGVQIWANDGADYQGKVWIDNIALGGKTAPQPIGGISFVKTDGPHFSLNNQRFRFIGANAEYLPFVAEPIVKNVLDRAQALGIKVIRTWGFGDGCEDNNLPSCADHSRYFQPSPGSYNSSAFEHFDHILLEARKRNIRLIIPLANNWDEYGGIPQYVCWQEKYNPGRKFDCSSKLFSSGELHDQFFVDENIKSLYKAYINHFVNHVNTLTGIRYADDPTIMAWELINEPRAHSDPSGATLHAWIVEMSGYLAGLAPHQLIGTGEEGWYIMPKESADKFAGWQQFPENYWHYGVNWARDNEFWGSNGADFVSDNSSTPRIVSWQEKVQSANESPTRSDERAGVPQVDFTTIHLYPAFDGTNLPTAPYCLYYGLDDLCASSDGGSHQAQEWIAQHVETSHKVLHKPFILEELNVPVVAKEILDRPKDKTKPIFHVTPEERARLFTQYLDTAYKLDVDGVMFWNLGYTGFGEQPWSEIPALRKWQAKTESDSLRVESIAAVSRTSLAGIQLEYDPSRGFHEATMFLADVDVDWLSADSSLFYVHLYNSGDAKAIVFDVQFSDGISRSSERFLLQPGENILRVNGLLNPVSHENSDKRPSSVIGISATLQNYSKTGSVNFEFRTIFNNKYAIYPGDPLEDVIHLAISRWPQVVPPTWPVLKINRAVTCGTYINPKVANEGVPIEFELTGGLEHPDGYFYRYMIADIDIGQRRPHPYEEKFAPMGWEQSGRIVIQPKYAGYNDISIAAEGESFEALGYYDVPGTDSCSFWVDNAAPNLTIDDISVDHQNVQPPYNTIIPNLLPISLNHYIDIRISGTDDVSSDLQLGCTLLNGDSEVDRGQLTCPSLLKASTKLGSMGQPSTISMQLPPGSYKLKLWLEDEHFAKSNIIVLPINTAYPLFVYLLIVLVLLLLIVPLVQRFLGMVHKS